MQTVNTDAFTKCKIQTQLQGTGFSLSSILSLAVRACALQKETFSLSRYLRYRELAYIKKVPWTHCLSGRAKGKSSCWARTCIQDFDVFLQKELEPHFELEKLERNQQARISEVERLI
ncbi:hypothetical protein CRM22_003575 [Opisthorchis felineus]|uniref:Uncharacterized protein n=1 Tax=Opisthorchis felineus TaxID=147828 RepID=A0A4S2M6N4_OPIFE|nr:hypothetical protein CRM22_003575 [Opisthorchis felineus]